MDDIFLYFMYPTAYICLQNKFGRVWELDDQLISKVRQCNNYQEN